ncbi:DUF167 family protein [Xanthobacter variabilis]|uniref:DUF167 family protein n=1 Tax=Xanthobacter variabilis TaxID=3119932 RepID=UPI00372CEF2B
MSVFRPTGEGIELHVRATPKGGRDALDGVAQLSDGRSVLKVRVRAAPEDGAATAAVAKVIADALGVSASRVTLASGATARLKTFRVEGDPQALAAALLRSVPEALPPAGAVPAPPTGPAPATGGNARKRRR